MLLPNIITEVSSEYILLDIAGLLCLQILILHPLCRIPSAHGSVKWCSWYDICMRHAHNIALAHYDAHPDPEGPNGIRPSEQA